MYGMSIRRPVRLDQCLAVSRTEPGAISSISPPIKITFSPVAAHKVPNGNRSVEAHLLQT